MVLGNVADRPHVSRSGRGRVAEMAFGQERKTVRPMADRTPLRSYTKSGQVSRETHGKHALSKKRNPVGLDAEEVCSGRAVKNRAIQNGQTGEFRLEFVHGFRWAAGEFLLDFVQRAVSFLTQFRHDFVQLFCRETGQRSLNLQEKGRNSRE